MSEKTPIRIRGDVTLADREELIQVLVKSEEDLIKLAKILDTPLIDSSTAKNVSFVIDGRKRILYELVKK